MQYLSLKDFNRLLQFDIVYIRSLISKLDLLILNWENNQIQIKNFLIKEHYTPNNFNIKKVLTELLIGLKNNPNDFLIKNVNMEKEKSSSYFNTDDFLDFIELFFDKVINNKILKTNLLSDDILNEYQNLSRNEVLDTKQYKVSYIDLKFLKKQLEEFAYQKYSKRILFSLEDLDNILNLYYIIEDDGIYEVDIRINKVNIITFQEYQNRLFNISIYEDMLYSKENMFKQTAFDKFELSYFRYFNNANKYFPITNIKNNLLNKMISFYEKKLNLFSKKDKFFSLNNMEKIVYFFNHKAKSMTNEEHEHILSIYNIKKFSMSYTRYNNIRANFKLLYDYDIFNNALFRHINFQI